MHPSSHDASGKPQRNLENEFFHKVDQDLIQRLRRKAEEEEGRKRLAQVTGINDVSVLEELLEAGVRAETIVAFSMVPLIWVAFADRNLDFKEREAVLRAAETVGVSQETASYQLLSSWCEQKPEERLFVVWRHYIKALQKITKPTTLQQLKKTITQRAREIAKATGGFLGIHKISEAEEAMLDEIENTFAESTQAGFQS